MAIIMDEKIMRTSIFGGFKKEDVLSFVEELQKQLEELKTEVASKQDAVSQLEGRVSELSAECEEITSLRSELDEKNAEIESVKAENAELSGKITELTAIKEEYDGEKQKFRNNNIELKAAQTRLGSAFLDARKYSDEIVAAANEKAHNTTKAISDDISKRASEISHLSQDVEKLSASFANSMNELQANITVLSQRMAAAAKNLSIRQDTVFEPDLTVKFDLDDDAESIIETNDGSGLTYIQYPPHTDFNEDLNIQADSSFTFNKKEEQA